jgi:hypothetical protein
VLLDHARASTARRFRLLQDVENGGQGTFAQEGEARDRRLTVGGAALAEA